ncbi:glycoside hydrolase family 117 protein [Rubripirellula obstinata]|nr:family 43 glycosylhydrolase [Rubripirellula obstinata]
MKFAIVFLVLATFFSLHACEAEPPQAKAAPETAPKTTPQAVPEATSPGFPFVLPKQKPDRPMSAAMERNYTAYLAPRPEDNELYSLFKYTQLNGFDYNDHDGTISRRDPSKVILANGKYYVWYTHRHTPVPPQGPQKCTDTIPSSDWDLADIWYATSEDGFNWTEQGVAIPRPSKPQVGWRSVTTTDILFWKGKYYLYYQGFMEASGTRGDDCPVAVSYADSPDGPWTPHNKIVIPNGAPGDWDQYSIHDPYPLVHNDKIYLYYKSDSDGDPDLVRMQGLAIADDPLGPFEKHPLNPVLSSGHETSLFPFQDGIAAMVHGDGNEHNTIQFAKDGVNFEIASMVQLMPIAAGPYVPDAFTNTTDGRGITWGISHFNNYTQWSQNHAVLARFDCDLSQDVHDSDMKRHRAFIKHDVYFKQGLNHEQRKRIEDANLE